MVDPPNQLQRRLGVEISRTALHAAILSESDEVVATRSLMLTGDGTSFAELVDLIDDLKTEFGGFQRCGIAVPGLVDRELGRVEFSANIPSHSDTDLVNDLNAATGLSIVIENDANAAALGEFRIGAGRGSRNIF